MKKRYRKITPEKRREIIRLAAHGGTYRQIADTVDLSQGAVGIVVRPLGGVTRREMWDQGTSSALTRRTHRYQARTWRDLSLRGSVATRRQCTGR